MSVTTIDLLRHGEAAGGEIFRGSTDVALTEKGWQQMQSAIAEQDHYDHIISSPMQRCILFAEQLAHHQKIPVSTNQRLKEISFGDWDGQTFNDVKTSDAERFNGFWRSPLENTPPNGEPLQIFYERVVGGFVEEVQRHQGRHLLMVVHGGVIKALVSYVMQSNVEAMMRVDVPFACKTRINIYHDENNLWPQLVFHRP